jgi:hypothetical protein
MRYPSLVAEFLQRSTSHQTNKSNNPVIIIMFSVTKLITMQHSMSTQIQDLQIGNTMIVNKDYHLLGCKTMQLADGLENNRPPSSRLQWVRFFVGSSLQP